MAASLTLGAELRQDTGKGVARKLRAAGRVPAVIYGHHRTAQALSVETRALGRLLERATGSSVIEIAIAGGSARALIREIQRHPVSRELVHVDFQELVAGEQVTVRVPLVFVGVADGVRNQNGMLEELLRELEISAEPSSIPDQIEVDVTAMTIGHPLHVRDIQLPSGVTTAIDGDTTVASVIAARTEEAAPAAPAAEAPAGDPEVLRAKKAEE